MTVKLDGTNGLLQQYDFQTPTTGFSYTFAAGTQVLVMNPAGTLATGTITMPSSPADGMTITFSSTEQITALTLSGNTGQTIGGTQVTLLPANSAVQFVYRLSNTTWYRITSSAIGNIGTAPLYASRAWVNFNGTGTVAIRASGNVSSITDNGTGDYTVNFTTAMSDANYAVSNVAMRNGSSGAASNGVLALVFGSTTYADAMKTGSVRIEYKVTTNNEDPLGAFVSIFR
jgi:hypothetical protein